MTFVKRIKTSYCQYTLCKNFCPTIFCSFNFCGGQQPSGGVLQNKGSWNFQIYKNSSVFRVEIQSICLWKFFFWGGGKGGWQDYGLHSGSSRLSLYVFLGFSEHLIFGRALMAAFIVVAFCFCFVLVFFAGEGRGLVFFVILCWFGVDLL